MEQGTNYNIIKKKDLIKQLKVSLLGEGFEQLTPNRWEMQVGGFICVVYVQGSRWEKDGYDIRLGVRIADSSLRFVAEGHFAKLISNFNKSYEEILLEIKNFFAVWTNKRNIVRYITNREDAWKALSNYSSEEYQLKKKEFYTLYDVATPISDIIDYVLSPNFLNE